MTLTRRMKRMMYQKWRPAPCGTQPSNLELDSPGGTLELSWVWKGEPTALVAFQESEPPHNTWVNITAGVVATPPIIATALFFAWFSSFAVGTLVKARMRRVGSGDTCWVESDVQVIT